MFFRKYLPISGLGRGTGQMHLVRCGVLFNSLEKRLCNLVAVNFALQVVFVSSPTDEDNLQSEVYRHQIAEALFKGIEQYTAPGEMRCTFQYPVQLALHTCRVDLVFPTS